jgi:hypothetical protein
VSNLEIPISIAHKLSYRFESCPDYKKRWCSDWALKSILVAPGRLSVPCNIKTGSYCNLTLLEGVQIVKYRGTGCITVELNAEYKKAGGSLYYF